MYVGDLFTIYCESNGSSLGNTHIKTTKKRY
jgi:hypothetical protein